MKAKGFSYLKKITAVDRGDSLEVVYIIFNFSTNEEDVVSVKLPAKNPEIDSVMGLFTSADWYEREMYEMFGISIGGRKVKRLLLEEWNSGKYPLRKDFTWGSNYRNDDGKKDNGDNKPKRAV